MSIHMPLSADCIFQTGQAPSSSNRLLVKYGRANYFRLVVSILRPCDPEGFLGARIVVQQNVVGSAVVGRAFLLQTVIARIVVQQSVVGSAVVARAAVELSFGTNIEGAGSGLFGAYFGAPMMPSANQTRLPSRNLARRIFKCSLFSFGHSSKLLHFLTHSSHGLQWIKPVRQAQIRVRTRLRLAQMSPALCQRRGNKARMAAPTQCLPRWSLKLLMNFRNYKTTLLHNRPKSYHSLPPLRRLYSRFLVLHLSVAHRREVSTIVDKMMFDTVSRSAMLPGFANTNITICRRNPPPYPSPERLPRNQLQATHAPVLGLDRRNHFQPSLHSRDHCRAVL